MHTIAELLKCVNGGVLSIKYPIQSQTPRSKLLSLGYITAATLNKINHLTFNSITIYIIDVTQLTFL